MIVLTADNQIEERSFSPTLRVWLLEACGLQ